MRDVVVTHATRSASVEVDAPEINLNKEDSRSSDTDSKRVAGGTSTSTKEGVADTFQNEMPSTGETHGTTAPASGGPEAAMATVARAGLPPRRRSPHKHPAHISNAPDVAKSSRDDSGYVPASTLFPPPAKSNVMEKTEVRSTTHAGGKPCTTKGGERPEQTSSFTVVENPSLNMRTSKLPVNISVPYSPNKKIGKKVAIETADSTPRPTNKHDDSAADKAEMFVDLSSLDSAKQLVRDPAATAPMMAQPMANGRKVVKFAEPIVQATPEEILSSLDEAYHRIEEEALKRRSSRGQGQSSSNMPAQSVSEDTVRSATPGSVRHNRVVHAPPVDDYEPEVKTTKEQNHLYDIVKRFGNARSNSLHMKELKA
ncbi:hypothetical protein VPH35_021657 [Triticum aestivum]